MSQNKIHLVRTTAKGNSMAPFIRSGARIVLNISPNQTYHTGDIVAYIGNKGAIVVHRIILTIPFSGRRRYILKGDNNRVVDRYIETRHILGKVQTVKYPSFSIDISTPFSASIARLVSYCGRLELHSQLFYDAVRLTTNILFFFVFLYSWVSAFVYNRNEQ